MITYENWKVKESLLSEAAELLCESATTESLEDLMVKVQHGRQDLRNELADRLSRYIRGIMWNKAQSNQFAKANSDDVVQEVLIRVFRNLDGDLGSRFKPGSTGGWLSRIVRNTINDMGRKEKRTPNTINIDQLDAPGEETASRDLERKETVAKIKSAISSLSKQDQEVLKATHLLGQRYRDVADQLGIPVGTVKSRLHKAKANFVDAANRMGLSPI